MGEVAHETRQPDNTDSFKSYLEWRAEAGPDPSLSIWSGKAPASHEKKGNVKYPTRICMTRTYV